MRKALQERGFAVRKRKDFVTYWMPVLQANDRSLVQWLSADAYGADAPMTVTPPPDATVRPFMIFRRAQVHEQAVF